MRHRIGIKKQLLKFGEHIYVKRRCREKHDTYPCSNSFLKEKAVFIYRGRDRYAVSDKGKTSLTYSGYRRESNNFDNVRFAIEYVNPKIAKIRYGTAQKGFQSIFYSDLRNFEKQPVQVAIMQRMKE